MGSRKMRGGEQEKNVALKYFYCLLKCKRKICRIKGHAKIENKN